ncbi:MAG: HslU--HslV peptidase ATPase subunit [Alphaproteobacteria bacterium RIFCSPLOWO2_01_FULL_40_26]|nr:MAG: HslU--HslV peptidase ATPase subunit [Alphaproteobacteria bacterium RIFCSPHIGHO2_02_FULL_40_34]OFW87877.1 MAG: HslU--HslV peptidase ATPase subunit [Alphaproteobacteria bacterium RIFCSPHIGHO2_01_FULL_40_8]OFW95060.1 MAG: HslU--HslV peptidase ATPase subunit [Alphaproteobacteria bacterium RIFCSPLOWO2_01_FULL_40_26]OFX10588.1 MAG: HslU--HslV peptidase ATPase subunit [Alphaproteobacteria bacterium RIFCSPLOWO2_02_FULL_40_19]OFX12140.1 MAG: HslU--HslV peptidase ATPase subunit [Alphaproteobacter
MKTIPKISDSETYHQVFNLTPKQIVEELNRYIVGQNDAKKSVSIALRNRYRRKLVESPLREEIVPKNILMVGPTGVGKTEVARRLAKLANAPFIKVEATKFTEVGYVGRDVDSIIRDLIEVAVKDIKSEMKKEIGAKAEKHAKKRVLKALVGENALDETREKFSQMLENGELNDREIEIELSDSPSAAHSFDIPGMHVGMINLNEMLNKFSGGERVKRMRMTVEDALKATINEESEKMIDEDKVIKKAIKSVENDGIVFIDEIDKICVRDHIKGGDVSREGVQRDLLPLVEGTAVTTKYGVVKTDHVLFIASGAFHIAKPADLLPELQGRFPIRVQLKALTEEDLVRILTEPEASLIKQYVALLSVENLKLNFTEDGIKEIARVAHKINGEVENIGARRLHTMLEKILEEISFEASDMKNGAKVVIDQKYVEGHLGDLAHGKTDLSKFIL